MLHVVDKHIVTGSQNELQSFSKLRLVVCILAKLFVSQQEKNNLKRQITSHFSMNLALDSCKKQIHNVGFVVDLYGEYAHE